MYLQISSIKNADAPVPQLQSLTLIPDKVKAGDSGRIFVKLDGQAPHEGVVVKLAASDPKIVFINPEVVITAGAYNVVASYSTRRRVPRRGAVVEITAEANGSTATAILTINR